MQYSLPPITPRVGSHHYMVAFRFYSQIRQHRKVPTNDGRVGSRRGCTRHGAVRAHDGHIRLSAIHRKVRANFVQLGFVSHAKANSQHLQIDTLIIFTFTSVLFTFSSTCKSCTIHVMTPNPPLLFSGNESLIFGPYHTFYGKLEEHMALLGLAPRPNLWDKPLYIGWWKYNSCRCSPDYYHYFLGCNSFLGFIRDIGREGAAGANTPPLEIASTRSLHH